MSKQVRKAQLVVWCHVVSCRHLPVHSNTVCLGGMGGCLWCLGGVWVLSEGSCVLSEGDSIKEVGTGQLVLQCSAAVMSPNSFQCCLSGEGVGVSVVSGGCLGVV